MSKYKLVIVTKELVGPLTEAEVDELVRRLARLGIAARPEKLRSAKRR